MSLLMGKSNSSCSAVSDESSDSLEHDEKDASNMMGSSVRLLLGVEDPAAMGPTSMVTPETDPHFVDEEACEIGLLQSVLASPFNFRNDSPTSEFHKRRKKSGSGFTDGGGELKNSDSLERRASASSLALSH